MLNYRKDKDFYYDGIVYQEPCAMRSLIFPLSENCQNKPYKLAVFDMDGTSINTSSPSKLVKRLFRDHKLDLFNALHIAKWGLTYKFHLPRENNHVRERVYTAFSGRNAKEVGRELEKFAEAEIVPHIRKKAIQQMLEHIEGGLVVILLSASFDSVVSRMMASMPVNFGIATLMRINEDGNITNKVQGIAPEGDGKPIVLREFANSVFGNGNWVVDFAYGDHMSDVDILKMSKHPVAVCPDRQLLKYAKRNGWKIVEW